MGRQAAFDSMQNTTHLGFDDCDLWLIAGDVHGLIVDVDLAGVVIQLDAESDVGVLFEEEFGILRGSRVGEQVAGSIEATTISK